MSASIGSLIGQYRIAREIGRGGMGVIYEAIHAEIGRQAAIKVLSPHCTDDPRYVRRFLNEARAISCVRHPGLVQIYDFGQTPSEVPYILMEFLDGETLRVRMARLPKPTIFEVRRVVRQIAAALAATHEQGIAHRDLKPENVMLVRDEEAPGGARIKLLDFGIARFFTSEGVTLTAPGAALGTVAYMSPEQCAGDPDIGGAADVYALGIMLYELLAGAPPFAGPTGSAVMRKHVVAEPPPLPAGAPPELAALAARMLVKEPTLRPSMREIVDALPESSEVADRCAWDGKATEAHEPATAAWLVTPRALRDRRRRTTVVVAAIAASVASAAAWPLYRAIRETEPKPTLVPTQPAKLTGMVWFSGGAFRMGHTAEEIEIECARLGQKLCRRDLIEREQPARHVTLSPFYLDELEATNEEVARWFATMPTSIDVRTDDNDKDVRQLYLNGVRLADLTPPYSGLELVDGESGVVRARPGDERKPAAQLTWDGASQYCEARGKRLPTEAEWEFAARGVDGRRFPWGDQEPGCDEVVWGRAANKACAAPSRTPGPAIVGTAPLDRTPEGVRDMGGNVTEWVQDQFRRPYYPACGACVDPRVEEPTSPHQDWRINRGGSWNHGWQMSRTTMRGRWLRVDVTTNGGVRCAR